MAAWLLSRVAKARLKRTVYRFRIFAAHTDSEGGGICASVTTLHGISIFHAVAGFGPSFEDLLEQSICLFTRCFGQSRPVK